MFIFDNKTNILINSQELTFKSEYFCDFSRYFQNREFVNGDALQLSGDVFQSQMLQMLNDKFFKLSTVLTDSKNDSKTMWPKFSGEISKFRDWYLVIMAQILLSPWNS